MAIRAPIFWGIPHPSLKRIFLQRKEIQMESDYIVIEAMIACWTSGQKFGTEAESFFAMKDNSRKSPLAKIIGKVGVMHLLHP